MGYDKERIEQTAVAARLSGTRFIEARVAAVRAKAGPAEALRALAAEERIAEAAFEAAMTDLFGAAVELSSLIVSQKLANYADIEECVQKVWEAISKPEKIVKFDPSKGSFCTWFSNFVLWRATDFGRELGKLDDLFVSRQNEDEGSGEDDQPESAGSLPGDDESFLSARLDIGWEQLEDAMKGLPPQDRFILVAYFGQDHSHEEVAQIIGVSSDNVRAKKSQALQKLRNIFRRRGWMK